MAKLTGLGKGLDALLSASKINLDVNSAAKTSNDVTELVNQLSDISLNKIQPGKYQPRKVFDEVELQELADSIRHNGVIQPVVLRKIAPERYELIAGERRFRASQIAGLESIPAIIREFSDEEALAVSLIENIQRKDLNIVEEAQGYRRLIDEFGLTHEALAQVTGKSRSNISNTLRLLNLTTQVLDMLLERKLDMGHARALLPLSEENQLLLAEEIIAKKLTTAEVENKVAKILHELKYGVGNIKVVRKDPDISRLEESIADKIGMVVGIKHNRGGHGKITINYSSVDELEGFLERLR
ncbi:MAG: ParB/RepB/Spo0J family partition protein [Neisseriales bacterium]|nr:MAG: ParB/RepB/Spo0J family partition protein [Neisseriales bacterium]